MERKPVKVFGAKRSGNNLMFLLLSANYAVDMIGNKRGGWTHGKYRVPEVYGREVDLVIIVKHPLAWLWSMFRYEGAESFGDYVRTTGQIDRWHELYRDWLGVRLKTCRKVVVRYEDVLTDAEKELAVVAAMLDLERRPREFYVPQRKMTRHGTEGQQPFDPSFYTERRFLEHYSPGLLKHAIGRFDWNLAAKLGYEQAPP